MIVREHLGTLLIAGERERNGSIVGNNYCYPATVFHSSESERISVFADSINAELEVQVFTTKWPLLRLCSDYVPIAKGFLLNFEKSTNREHVDRLDSDFPDGIFGGSPHIFSVSEWEKECT